MESNDLDFIQAQLEQIEELMHQATAKRESLIQQIHPSQFYAAKNLLHYLVLRTIDIRELQILLHIYGLSSIASSESHVLRQIQSIQERLGKVYDEIDAISFSLSNVLIKQKSEKLFGRKKEADIPALMVTFDSHFSEDYVLVKNLLKGGMGIARINCAHDDEYVWQNMIQHIKKASKETGLNCKIYMDLAGPKIRTRLLGKGKDKGKVKVKEGQLIWMAESTEGIPKGEVVISPNEPGIVEKIRVGDRVYLDDGVIRCLTEKVKKGKIGLRITRVSNPKSQIKNEKGINFPDTILDIDSLTDYDRSCLPFIAANADLIGYSFVRKPADIHELRGEFLRIGATIPGLIIKIETQEAVRHLPDLLFEGMREPEFGVMIARGDLAVEIGFERMAEIQEEILWICEAAHVPVVWATQVLETLNKSGIATRSEISDAALSAGAECVMINKGAHTIKVLTTLKDILKRTSSHRAKKRFTFRPLKIAERFFEEK